jgi:hypothetical protein
MEDAMNENELREIEARKDAATPGPWTFEAGDFSGNNWLIGSFLCGNSGIDGEDYHVTTDNLHGSEIAGNSDAKTDAEFIAHSREDIETLLHEVRRLQAVVAEYASIMNWVKSASGYVDLWRPNEHGYTRAENALKDGE